MTIDLEPCPFCGNKVDTQSFWYGAAPGDEPRGYHVFCLECSETDALDGPRRDTLDEAIAAWNTRAPSAAARERDGLREALELAARRFEAMREGEPHVPSRVAFTQWASEARQSISPNAGEPK